MMIVNIKNSFLGILYLTLIPSVIKYAKLNKRTFMALIDLSEIHKSYDTKKILIDVNFQINEAERIVIVGKNGSGKSTLMKIIEGAEKQDEGDRILSSKLEVKMLAQRPVFKVGQSVKESILDGLTEIKEALDAYEVLSKRMETEYEDNAVLEEFNKTSAFLDHHNAWDINEKIERIIKEFDLEQFENRSVDLLSGGEQRRVALATLLLQKPDILLLDEPTNHLDVYMVEYLEELILKEQFTLVFISHDRYFIDQIATKTVEVDAGSLTTFTGGYSDYLEQKEQMLAVMEKQHHNLLRLVRRENEWYARGVRARLKRNEGRKARLMDLRKSAKSNPSLIRTMSVQLEREKQSFQNEKGMNKQKQLFEINEIDKQLGDKVLIKNFTHRILQKDIIAIVGHNGTGKSTLLKLLLGRMKVDKGEIKQGEFKVGYFDQHREMLDDDRDLLETFCPNGGDRVDVQGTNMHVFGYLKNFLFPKEFLNRKIGVLSGGEKNRVALALLFTKKVDCLILDEPTNDLDIPTINILEEKLESFPGAIIIVSHDRYFIDKIASKLLIFKGNGVIEESHQPYSEYLELEKEMKEVADMSTEFNINDAVRAIQSAKPKEEVTKEKPKSKEKLTFKEKNALDNLPKEIEALEAEIEAINSCLADPSCYEKEGLSVIAKKLEETQELYNDKENEYLEVLEKQERIEG